MAIVRASNQEIIDMQLPDEEEQIDEELLNKDKMQVTDLSRAQR